MPALPGGGIFSAAAVQSGTGTEDVVSKYAYANDSRAGCPRHLARRTSVVRTGSAFDDTGGASPSPHNDTWSYNARNELTGSTR